MRGEGGSVRECVQQTRNTCMNKFKANLKGKYLYPYMHNISKYTSMYLVATTRLK